jgi:hypothetical protein
MVFCTLRISWNRISDWLPIVFHFGTENWEEQLKKAPCIYDNPDKQDDDDENVVDNDNKDDNNCHSMSKSSCFRQPCKHGSTSGPIERTA